MFFIVFAVLFLTGCGTVAPLREAERSAAPVANAPAPGVAPATSGSIEPSPVNDMLFHALAAAGVDYRRGGKSLQTGFDCSGLVAFVYREAYGLDLPHNTLAQSHLGEPIEALDLQTGDLVFFNTLRRPFSHVGIYVGDGRFIHAPREGSAVRTENLRARYWSTRFDGARRIVPSVVSADFPSPPRKPVVTYP